jgi:predicted DNA-binding protein
MKKSQQTKTLTISLPIELYKTLELKAEKNDRSKNYLVRKALEAHLDGKVVEKTSNKKPTSRKKSEDE